MFRLWWMSNRALRERADYLERIASLKWDIWFYYTGVQLLITFLTLALIVVCFIIFAFTIQNDFVDPFASSKIAYYILNIVFIIVLAILNFKFIFKTAQKETRNKKMLFLLIISIIAFVCSISMFFIMNSSIHTNIDLLHNSNPDMYRETIFSTLIPNTSDLNYFIPFWMLSIIFLIVLGFIVYLDAIWLYRLDRTHEIVENTDILFDDEQNVKY